MGDVRAKLAELLPEEVEHFLKEVPRLLAEGCQFKQLFRCLTDFDFLEAKVNHPGFGVQALIEDYDLVDDSEVLAHPEYNPEKVKALKLIQGAIGLSAPVLVKDKTQLAGQLLGRLLSFEVPEIQAMLNQAKQRKDSLWLCALTPSLTRPGGRLLRTFTGHTKSVNAVAVIPKTDLVISGSSDSTLKVWSLETGKELLTLTGHTDSINAVAITPDGKRVISGSSDSTLKVWNLETGEELLTYHSKPITAVAVTPDGKRVISGSFWVERFYYTSTPGLGMPFDSSVETWHGTLNIWDLDTGENFLTLHPPSGNGINAVAVTLDGKQVISGSSDKTLKVWNLETGQQQFTFPDGSASVNAIAITSGDQQVISGLSDGVLIAWNLETREKVLYLSSIPDEEILSFTRYRGGDIYIRLYKLFLYIGLALLLLLIARASLLLLNYFKDILSLFNSIIGRFLNLVALFFCVSLIGAMPTISALNNGKDNYNQTAIAVTANGKQVISGSSVGTLKVWDLENRKKRFILTGHTSSVNAVAVIPNTYLVISGSSDKTLKVWDLKTGKNLFPLIGHSDAVNAIAVIPNTYLVISGSSDKTLKVWNAITGRTRFTLTGHRDAVTAVAVTSNGRQAISTSLDNTLKVWDLSRGKLIASFTGDSALLCCAVAPDGVTIVAGEASGRVHFLRLEGIEA